MTCFFDKFVYAFEFPVQGVYSGSLDYWLIGTGGAVSYAIFPSSQWIAPQGPGVPGYNTDMIGSKSLAERAGIIRIYICIPHTADSCISFIVHRLCIFFCCKYLCFIGDQSNRYCIQQWGKSMRNLLARSFPICSIFTPLATTSLEIRTQMISRWATCQDPSP